MRCCLWAAGLVTVRVGMDRVQGLWVRSVRCAVCEC